MDQSSLGGRSDPVEIDLHGDIDNLSADEVVSVDGSIDEDHALLSQSDPLLEHGPNGPAQGELNHDSGTEDDEPPEGRNGHRTCANVACRIRVRDLNLEIREKREEIDELKRETDNLNELIRDLLQRQRRGAHTSRVGLQKP
jgi:hypothetical protein